MADFQHTTTVGASRDDLFDYLSRVDNLPNYMARMTSARHTRGDEVVVTARVGDEETTGDAWLTIDADNRTMAWGSPGPSDYHGELTVTGDDARSTVEVRLHTERDVDAGTVEQGIHRTLENVRTLVEARGVGRTGEA